MPRAGRDCQPETIAADLPGGERESREAMGGRFGRRMRLSGARGFEQVFAHGVRSRGPALTVLARPNGRPVARLGLAIARKHLRRAVDRNRVKRRIRASFRKHHKALRGLDIVVVARPGIAQRSLQDIDAMLETHWPDILGLLSRSAAPRVD